MSRKKSLLCYTLSFVAVFFAAFLAFFTEGKSFVWESDGFRQYYPALRYLGIYYRDLVSNIVHGDFTLPMIDYTIGQGEDIITTFANYGLGDPFTLLSMLVPQGKSLEPLYAILLALRMYVSGIAFMVYGRGMKISWKSLPMAALVYVFCGYTFWSMKDPFFLNGMIYLPLVLLGIEKVMRRENPWLLAGSVFVSLISGYYFFYMIVLCAVGYFVVRSIGIYGKDILSMTRAGVRCMSVALGGVLLSGVLILPCIYGYLGSSRGATKVSIASLFAYDWEYYRNMILRFVAATENDDAGTVAFYTMATVVLVAVVVLFVKREKATKFLRWSVVLTVVAVASPLVGYVMNGLGYVTNRFMFIPTFVMALVVAKGLPQLLQLNWKEHKKVVVICGIYALVCLLLTKKQGWLPTISMLVALAVTLGVLYGIQGEKRKRWILYGVVACNLAWNGNLLYGDLGVGFTDAYLDAGTLEDTYHEFRVSDTKEAQSQLGRVDDMTEDGMNPNRTVAMGDRAYPGTSVYYSVIHGGYSDYMQSLENTPDLMYTHRVFGNDGRVVLENLSNVRYVVSRDKEMVPYGFEKVKSVGKGIRLYKNTNTTSIGYTYDAFVAESEYDKANVFERQNTLLEAAVLSDGSKLAKQAAGQQGVTKTVPRGEWESLSFEMTDVYRFTWKSDTIRIKKRNGGFSIPLQREAGYEYYLRLGDLRIQEAKSNDMWANVTLGDLFKRFIISNENYDFYFGRNDYLIHLGAVEEEEAGKQETLKFRIHGPAKYHLENVELIRVPVKQVSAQVAALNQESLQQVKRNVNGFEGTLKVSKDKILCLAVPYSEGYQLLVDGKETDIEVIQKMYVGAWIPAGEHDIELRYVTPGLWKGAIISLVGVIYLVIVMMAFRKRWKKVV